ncbi:energy-coupling factor transporter transmembrane component T family protein [Methanolobus halotolerans]|uniref:Energy-coupling factor transporter transmembrane protein EcfT n=1 Tax=Methanolobus halotolerans TaxID=2052935 RepID=A0A4E0PYB9_9EURY|nr:energy-coupling factor transporter transmembrane protein EcfT [Methanolobus halotolerans]TGC11134.1 energy-coupling factor transporter transmembrane protein EcfT [Methanolobus halotolerans]
MSNLFFTYIPGTSLIHRLDPRTKIISVMIASMIIFKLASFAEMALIGAVFLILSLVSSIPFKVSMAAVKPMIVFLVIIFLMQLFLTEGTALFSLSGFSATREGLHIGLLLTVKFVYLLLFASLLTATTAPSMLTAGIERMLRPLPLKKAGISSFDLATMMSLSIHFFPLLYEHLWHLKDAQMSRGLDPGRSPFKTVYSLSVPMMRTAFRSAEEVSFAMESRCYQGICRTSLFDPRMQRRDFAALSAFVVVMWVILFFA